jgi:hypothetical protein
MAPALQYLRSKKRKTTENAMNTKSILASLVLLGSSSAAIAAPRVTLSAPGVTFSATPGNSYGTAVIRDHRTEDDCDPAAPAPIAQPVVQPVAYGWNGGWYHNRTPPVYRPVTLASAVHFAGDGRTFIGVGSQTGQFETLHINAAAGRTFIKQVYVQFANGQEQVIRDIDRNLAGGQSVSIDLDGGRRSINRIVVYGSAATSWRQSGGTFSVTAS